MTGPKRIYVPTSTAAWVAAAGYVQVQSRCSRHQTSGKTCTASTIRKRHDIPGEATRTAKKGGETFKGITKALARKATGRDKDAKPAGTLARRQGPGCTENNRAWRDADTQRHRAGGVGRIGEPGKKEQIGLNTPKGASAQPLAFKADQGRTKGLEHKEPG
jgi:hypothetical protein